MTIIRMLTAVSTTITPKLAQDVHAPKWDLTEVCEALGSVIFEREVPLMHLQQLILECLDEGTIKEQNCVARAVLEL